MISKSGARCATVLITILVMGCVHRTTTNPDFGIPRVSQQTKGAFNPLTDDPRIQLLQARLKGDPLDTAARLDLAGIYEGYGLYEAGVEQYTEGFRLNKDQAALPMLHNNLGYNFLLQNKLEAAETEFRKALELNADSATARNNLGVVLARRGDLEGALAQFQRTADEPSAHNNLAVVLFEAGQYEQSRDQLIKALAVRPDFDPALSNLKLVQEKIRRSDLQKKDRR